MVHRLRVRIALAVGLLAASIATPAASQTACTTPLDPACNHLKCYQISDKPSTVVQKTPIVQVDNQFGREVLFRLQPVMLCVPSQKACCDSTGACTQANCRPNPVPAPGLPHFKCYKIKAKTCPNNDCTAKLAPFPKRTIQVNLTDQFGTEQAIPVGNPVMLCAPVDKQVVGQTTSTTNSTTTTVTQTSTTTTTQPPICHFDVAANHCTGSCPPTLPAGTQCLQVAADKCDCVAPPVCCQCSGSSGPACFDTNTQCPPACSTNPNANCDSNSGLCGCGLCRDPASPTACVQNMPCSTSQPCPSNLVCDPAHCPAPCDPCTQAGGACSPTQCLRPDGTKAQCLPTGPSGTCTCCNPPGTSCTTDSDCCSGVCNATGCS